MDGDGQVKAAQIRDMLGLSDRGAVRRLFAKLLEGDSAALLDAIAEQYKIGVEPLSVMNGLLSLSHQVTLFKVGRASDPTLSDDAKQQFSDWAQQLSYPVLHRLWQLLLKGYQEVQQAHLPREACEMALLRVLCAADMPDPGKLAKILEQGGMTTSAPQAQQAAPAPPVAEPVAQIRPAPAPPPGPVAASEPQASALPNKFADVVKTVGRVSAVLESILIADVRLISLDPPNVIYQPVRPIADADIRKITDALRQETGQEWKFTEGQGEAQPSLVEQEQQVRECPASGDIGCPVGERCV